MNFNLKKKIALCLLSLVYGASSYATDYYWVGGAGNWSDISHWATTSGGSVKHTIVPTTNDNVFFDANSGFTASSKTVTINAVSRCKNMKWEGCTVAPVISRSSASYYIEVGGSLKLQSGMTVSGTASFDNAMFSMISSQQGETITTAGVNIGGANAGMTFNGTGGWILQDPLTVLSITGTNNNSNNKAISFIKGTLDFNGQTVTADGFYSDNSNTRYLKIAKSKIYVWNSWTYTGTGSNVMTNLETAGSLIQVERRSFDAKQGDRYHNIEFVGSTYTSYYHSVINGSYNKITYTSTSSSASGERDISTANFFSNRVGGNVVTDTLIFAASGRYQLYGTTTVNKYFSSEPASCGGLLDIRGESSGTIAMGTSITNAVNIKNTRLKNVKITGNAPTAYNSIDLAGNTGFTFQAMSAKKTYYWVGGSGNWNDPSHWSTTSGVSNGSGCVPTPFDDVVFNDASGITSGTVTVDKTAYCDNMKWLGTSGTPAFVLNNHLEINGSLLLQSGMTVSAGNASIYFTSNRANETIRTNGVVIQTSVSFYSYNGNGGWVFQDAFQVPYFVNFYSGNLNFNGQYVLMYGFSSSGNSGYYSSTRTLNIAQSTIDIINGAYSWNYTGGTPLQSAQSKNSLIRIQGITNAGNGLSAKSGDVYYNVEFVSNTSTHVPQLSNGVYNRVSYFTSTGQITGTVTVDSLLFETTGKYTLATNIAVNKYLATKKFCGGMTSLSSSNTTQRTISMGTPSNVAVSNMFLQNIKITGPGANYTITNSKDLGGNSGWTFGAVTSHTYYWVGGNGDWNDPSHWSTTSGLQNGSGCVPTPFDNVIFDNKSFSSSGQAVTVGEGTAYCNSMTWTGNNTLKPVLSLSNYLEVSGSVVLQEGMTIAYPSNSYRSTSGIKMVSDVPGATITSNGAINSVNWVFDGTGGWVLQDPFMMTRASSPYDTYLGSITFTNGNLNFNGKSVLISNFYSPSTASSSRVLNIANSVIEIDGGYWQYEGGTVLTASQSRNSTIKVTSRSSNTGSNVGVFAAQPGAVYNNIEISKSNSASNKILNGTYNKITFSNGADVSQTNHGIESIVVDTLILASGGKVYQFAAGTTSVINKLWVTSGTPCLLTTIKSTINGTCANISMPSAAANDPDDANTVLLDLINLRDINAVTGAGRAILKKGNQSPDSGNFGLTGNNSNWNLVPYAGSAGFKGLGNDVVMDCDEPYTMQLSYAYRPDASGTYEWRQNNSSGAVLSTASKLTVSTPGTYWMKVTYGASCSLTTTKTLYSSTDSLIWTGKQSADWNDYRNWKKPDGKVEAANVPRKCTNVLIPGKLSVYPSLLSSSSTTNYAGDYPDAVCHHIWFEYGGEVARTDSLHYLKAFIDLRLPGNRWYMVSAPLQGMFPGDYYKTDPNPIADGLIVYTQLFAQSNPQTGQATNSTGSWTGTFNTPNVAMPAGFGFAVWFDDGTPIERHDSTTISFPKHDDRYYYYNYDGVPYDVVYLTRTNEHRFVYEPVWNKLTGVVTLTASASKGGVSAIVGNPFMSHWKFEEFQSQNSTEIANEYKFLTPGAGAFTTWTPSVPNGMTNRIAPMQSILLTSLKQFNNLTTNAKQTTTVPGVTLRSASSETPQVLMISAIKGDSQNSTAIIPEALASNDYVLGEDSHKLFVDTTKNRTAREAIVVYTRSDDGVALDVNVFGDLTKTIPLGIRTTQTGTIKLQFTGLEELQSNYEIYLYDTQKSEGNNQGKINLFETPEYSFNKTTNELYLDGQLYLSFISKAPNANQLPEANAVSIFTKGNQLQIIGNSNIKEVQVIDMWGRIILRESNIENTIYSHTLEKCGMYIVKVQTEQGITVKKVTMK